jgi:hypothetical protein
VKAIQEYAFARALSGHKWNGWKLVEGRSNRVYKDDKAVGDLLLEKGYTVNDVYDLKGITAMEKVLGKKKFKELLDGLIIKPAGKPTMARESDARAEYNSISSAIEDFKE